MRVIAGSAKGVRLAPVPHGVRPVSDMAREGMFSSLGAAVPGAAVLDVFAGTGALAIEALSRGAERAVLVERSRAATRAIEENLRRTRLEDRARVILGDAWSVVMGTSNPLDGPFDLVLADPPYATEGARLDDLVAAVAAGVVADGGSIVLTRAARSSTFVIPIHWLVSKRLEYGDTAVLILRRGAAGA